MAWRTAPFAAFIEWPQQALAMAPQMDGLTLTK